MGVQAYAYPSIYHLSSLLTEIWCTLYAVLHLAYFHLVYPIRLSVSVYNELLFKKCCITFHSVDIP